MTQEDIQQMFISAEENAVLDNEIFLFEYLKLMYPIYKTHYLDPILIESTGTAITFIAQKEEQIYTSVTVNYTQEIPDFTPVHTLLGNEIGDVILDFLDKISPSINLSALRSGNN